MVKVYVIMNKRNNDFQKWNMCYIKALYTTEEIAEKNLKELLKIMNAIIGFESCKKEDYEITKIEIIGE